MEIRRSDNCLRCNRKLKDPESVERGYGKICFEKANAAIMGVKPLIDKDGRIATSEGSFYTEDVSFKESKAN